MLRFVTNVRSSCQTHVEDSSINYSAPVGERSIAIGLSVSLSVRLHVCLSVCEYISGTTGPTLTKLLCRSPVSVARFSAGGVAIRYVLPVSWMASRLAIVGRVAMCG